MFQCTCIDRITGLRWEAQRQLQFFFSPSGIVVIFLRTASDVPTETHIRNLHHRNFFVFLFSWSTVTSDMTHSPNWPRKVIFISGSRIVQHLLPSPFSPSGSNIHTSTRHFGSNPGYFTFWVVRYRGGRLGLLVPTECSCLL